MRIVKVGGSLLDWPLLAKRLGEWLEMQPPDCSTLIAGGGDWTDAIRRAQAIHQFDDEAAHWMCVHALGVTAQLLRQLVPVARLVRSLGELATAAKSDVLAFDPASFLIHDERRAPGTPLPHDWTATTDSIAARVAALANARELVLFKSADPPPGLSLAELAAAGYVDEHFPIAAASLSVVRLVNPRGDSNRETVLRR